MKNTLRKLMADKKGQSMTEYAMILAVIAAVVIVSTTTLGTSIATIFTDIIASFPS